MNGALFVNESGDFTNDLGQTEWRVAESIDRTRALEINVTDKSDLSIGKSDAFNLSVRSSATLDFWNMTVYQDPTSSRVNVTVETTDGDNATCSRDVSVPFTIDVTAGRFAGEPCHALTVSDDNEMWYAAHISSTYDVWFTNADKIEGGYEGIVWSSSFSNPISSNFLGLDQTAIYSVDVLYTYQTPSLRYETVIRVAPEEPGP